MILSHTKTQDLTLENLMWIFVFFLSLLHTQAGQTFSSYLGGSRTGGRGLPETTDRSCQGNKSSFVANTRQKKHQRSCPEPSKKFPIDSSSLPSPPHLPTLPVKPLALAGEKLPIVPSAAARFSSIINEFSILQTPHSSFFQSPSRLALQTPSAGRFSAFHLHLSSLKPFNAVKWTGGNNGADRWDPSNLQWIGIWLK